MEEDNDRIFRRPRDAIRVLVIILIVFTIISTSFISGGRDVRVYGNMAVVSEEETDWDSTMDYTSLVDGLRRGKEFHWHEWLDLNKTKMFHEKNLNPKFYPNLYGKSAKDLKFPPTLSSTAAEYAMLGRLFCERDMVKPYRVVKLGDPMKPELSKQAQVIDLKDTSSDKCHRQYGQSSCSTFQNITMQKEERTPQKIENIDYLVKELSDESFYWNPGAISRTDAHSQNPILRAHGTTIKEALRNYKPDSKHFHELHLKHDPLAYSLHYDWRFFRGITGYDDQLESLQFLTRAWAQFADTFDLTYWISHGCLLGWWWNGISLPWDRDLDFQMPIADLNRLAREFNGTLVVSNEHEGKKAFYIDVSPWYAQRLGNEANTIDARFIDITKGTYVDITGLAYTESDKSVHCKAHHGYTLDALSPLRRSLFEGVPVMVPYQTDEVLRDEYPKFDEPTYKNWVYNPKIRHWESILPCEDFLKDFTKGSNIVCPPTKNVSQEECDYTTFGTCNAYSLALYARTNRITELHRQESDIWIDFQNRDGELVPSKLQELTSILGTYHPVY